MQVHVVDAYQRARENQPILVSVVVGGWLKVFLSIVPCFGATHSPHPCQIFIQCQIQRLFPLTWGETLWTSTMRIKRWQHYTTGWWFGCHFLFFPYIGNFIIPIDFHIFQRGGWTTNQKGIDIAQCVSRSNSRTVWEHQVPLHSLRSASYWVFKFPQLLAHKESLWSLCCHGCFRTKGCLKMIQNPLGPCLRTFQPRWKGEEGGRGGESAFCRGGSRDD